MDYLNLFHYRKLALIKKLPKDIFSSVNLALKEDLGNSLNTCNDITSMIIPKAQRSHAFIITREPGIFCGKYWLEETFRQLDEDVTIQWLVSDGDNIIQNQFLCRLTGYTRSLLTGERIALNFLQTLSGIASKVRLYVNQLNKTNTILLDTRKTLPGLRTATKYAVLCGGGNNHRLNLQDSFLIKENHIAASGSIASAIKNALLLNINSPIEVEVTNLEELNQALEAKANVILLDNVDIRTMLKAVKLTKDKAILGVSGNISLKKIKSIVKTGVHFISIGALTKHIRALDLSMHIFQKNILNVYIKDNV